MQPYIPEGLHALPPTAEQLHRGAITQEVFRAMCTKCDEHHNLHVELDGIKGIIPREEAAIGIADGKAKEIAILSRVGKPVCFQILGFDREGNAILSRKAAQLEARSYFLNALRPGDVIPVRIQSVADFGLFCDIGCGFLALMPIERCCISRLRSCADLYHPGQEICASVWKIDDASGRILLSGRELLGTWEENAEGFRQGQTVPGIVRSIMPYGIFVELTPNLSGLAEPAAEVRVGDAVSVYLRAILPAKHKIKLNILERLPTTPTPVSMEYFITSGHIGKWEYYPGSRSVTYF